MQRMLTLSANISGEDLGRSAARVQQAISDTGEPPARVNVTVRGQVQPMAEMFGGLRLGLLMAVGLRFTDGGGIRRHSWRPHAWSS